MFGAPVNVSKKNRTEKLKVLSKFLMIFIYICQFKLLCIYLLILMVIYRGHHPCRASLILSSIDTSDIKSL